MRRRRQGFSLYAYIATLFVALLFGFAAVTITTQYIQTRKMLLVSADALSERIGEQTRQGLGRITEPAILTVSLLSRSNLAAARTEEDRIAAVSFMAEALRSSLQLSAVYVGYKDGDFFSVRPINLASAWGRSLDAPKGDAYLVPRLAHDAAGNRAGRFLF